MFYWDPPKEFLHIPFIERPIMWYGVLFVTGFFLGYFLMIPLLKDLFKKRQEPIKVAAHLTDRLLWFVLAGTIIGARLGHVFFYEWPRYRHDFWGIFKTWEGGLASHGGAIGVLLALVAFYSLHKKNYPELSLVKLVDILSIPTALAAVFIRLGNFVNQEIIGVPTKLSWGIIFGHPADGGPVVARHPAQLYEAFAYLLTFVLLYTLWWKGKRREGLISGLFFVCVFGSRFLIESIKVPLSSMMDESFIQTGQLLSIPFIALGLFLLLRKRAAQSRVS